jgi:DNA-binding NtrC family response regulator
MKFDNPTKRILVITIDEPLAEVIPALLRDAYQCDSAYEHEAVLEALRQADEYDLIICQVAALEREEKFLAWALRTEIPIISMAVRPVNQVSKVIRERCIFLQVPFEKEQLRAMVRGVFEIRRKLA